ncbi:MAG: cyclic beta 1-2 glucan synthetase, partial [Methanospirillum sp.]|uniref:glucoamylase family protein n=1 Tax=Methanospirillum sp. TaxID=45200 RepID=UPI002369229A
MWNRSSSKTEIPDKEPAVGVIDADPLRAELYSREQLIQHAKETAFSYQADARKGHERLLPRLGANERVLLETHAILSTVIETNQRVAPAGEWLLDNFYLIEEQIRTARRHLTKEYSKELPHLVNGPFEGFPRVYQIARELIAHSDGRIDSESLFVFIDAYQSVNPLMLGELWAIPIMLRLSLIENLRRISDILASNKREIDSVNIWVDRITKVAKEDPKSLILVIADLARSNPPLTSAFVAEIARQLQGQSGTLAFPLTWIEQRLFESNLTIEQMISAENQTQAADQVSIGNSIGSLRLLDKMNWREFIEQVSLVEQILRSDHDDVYAAMDFETRDQYRHVIEDIGKKSAIEESKIALKAVELARESRNRRDTISSRSHVGYYLIDKGRHSLEEALGYQKSLIDQLLGLGKSHLLFLYLTGILFITIIVEIFGYTRITGTAWFLILPFMVLLLIPISQASISLGNWFITLLLTPVPLPKMTYSSGIPDDQKTIVVIPTVVSGTADVTRLLDSLEIRYLGNRDENLFFALLTDLRNADTRELPEDAEIVSLLTTGIEELNTRYYDDKQGIFFLMHRSRSWNSNEGRWMGYERKRGILEAFSILISGKGDDLFSHIVGDLSLLTSLKYVITLDTDTQLPRNSARDLIGAIAHPLNHPIADPKTGVIREGYGILQPRVSISVSESGSSHFASIFGGELGIDPYTRTVSDVYQDAFHEGSFIGKGIYDLEIFSRSVEGRFPDNLILSHDLLEGCYVRTALVSDIQVFEEYPSSYIADIRRRHRWVRGDWQIGSWIFSSVPDNTQKKIKNPLSVLSRWKIFDNLRRSLVAPASILLLCITWLLVSNSLFWTGFIVSLALIPPIILTGWKSIKKPSEQTWRLHLHDMVRVIRDQLAAPLITLVFLPFEAYMYLDAILRSSWRMGYSHHHLLEWTTHQEVGRAGHTDMKRSYQIMWPGPVIGMALLISMIWYPIGNAPVIVLFASVWILSPALAWWISQPVKSRITSLTPGQKHFLRETARKTWRFFDTFVTAEDHYLITDNYQEHPVVKVAHRTSPTNIGLSLLANLTAYDFGYIPAGDLLDRTRKIMNTLGELKRFRGHFYNWYDTLTLEPLLPRYVSTVDSGNLVGNLLVLKQAMNEIPDNPIVSGNFDEGIADTIRILTDALDASHTGSDDNLSPDMIQVLDKINELKHGRILIPGSIRDIVEHLGYVEEIASEIEIALSTHPDGEVRWWSAEIKKQIQNHKTDVLSFISWTTAGTPPATIYGEIPSNLNSDLHQFYSACENLNTRIPTIREIATLQEDMQTRFSQLLSWADTSAALDDIPGSGRSWLMQTLREIRLSSARAAKFLLSLNDLTVLCGDFAEIEYEFLYDRVSNLLSIGYNVTDLRLDPVLYDLLASEARITSFIGIATGHLPQKHWFALGRLLTTVGSANTTLISWSGSMFEYLMPLLVMPTYENSLLDSSYHTVVARQIEYGRKRGVPWGISESGYNLTDTTLNYQYRAFGVPGLGFKRGLAGDLVVAPYAAAMALMINPNLASVNLMEMENQGFTGDYGFYEAIDYTPSRITPGKTHAVVQSFMAHHQGMILLSIAYVLLNRPMQRRFESDPRLQATIMLLQEKMPRHTPFYPHSGKEEEVYTSIGERESQIRVFKTYQTPWPEVHLLSNGRYHVMVNNSGSGYSRWNDLAVTRWREDPTTDSSGTFCYIRDLASGEFWSNGYQPSGKNPDSYQVIFKQARAEFQRRDREFETRSEIIVSPEDDVELRRIRVTNRSYTKKI